MTSKKALNRLVKRMLWTLSPWLFNRLVAAHRGQVFSIGVMWGANPRDMQMAQNNPVLESEDVTDVPAAFVADPFLIRREDQWHMFFEVLNRIKNQGQIGFATSDNGTDWVYRQVVLSQPFHLAYPHVFSVDHDIYMIPDTPTAGVRLYRAIDYPKTWSLESVILEGSGYSDSSVFFHEGRWWMFVARQVGNSRAMDLLLYHAESLNDVWELHPLSPLAVDPLSESRPAGRVVSWENRPVRLAQDCTAAYGHRVRAFEITRLTPTEYQECEVDKSPFLEAGAERWRRGGMHHIDLHAISDGWIASVDGWHFSDPDKIGSLN